MCFGISYSVFKRIFGRKTDPPLDEVKLKGTHYEKWMDKIYASIGRLRGLEWKELYIKGCNGDRLKALMHDVSSDKTVVICHGYRTHYFCNTAVAANYFLDRGYNIILLILRGHEGSEGKYITFGALEHKDLLLWLDMFENKMHLKQIVLYGISLGSNTVMRASEYINPGAVKAAIADCGFINTRETLIKQIRERALDPFQKVVFPVIFKAILKGMRVHAKHNGFDIYEGDTRVSLSKTCIPFFFLHGVKDRVVDVKDTQENYLACASDKQIFISGEAEHGGCFVDGGAHLRSMLDEFLGKYVK